MKTFIDQDHAEQFMRIKNRGLKHNNNSDVYVMVDGPDDGEFTIMLLEEAQDGDFHYTIIF